MGGRGNEGGSVIYFDGERGEELITQKQNGDGEPSTACIYARRPSHSHTHAKLRDFQIPYILNLVRGTVRTSRLLRSLQMLVLLFEDGC